MCHQTIRKEMNGKKKGQTTKTILCKKKKMPIQVWGPSTPKPVYSSKYWRN